MVYYFIGGSVPSGTGRLPCPTQGIPKSTGVSSLSLWNGITWYNFGGIPYVYIYICVCAQYIHMYIPQHQTHQNHIAISPLYPQLYHISLLYPLYHNEIMKNPWKSGLTNASESSGRRSHPSTSSTSSSNCLPARLKSHGCWSHSPQKRNIQQTLLGDFQGMPQASVPLKRMLFWEATCCSKGLDVISFKSPWYQYMNPSKGLVANFSFASS